MYQEEQQQYVGEDQEQALEQDLTNFVDTQGKHRFIYPNILHRFKFMQAPVHFKTQCHYIKFESYNYYYTIAFKFIGVDWYLVAWVGFVHPESLISEIN